MRDLLNSLERDGIAVLPDLVRPDQLVAMRSAFDARLRCMRWNNFDGYEKTETYRHMVQDVLTLDQAFVDIALHPWIKDTLRAYLGDDFEVVEAKGWKSLPTRKDFHGWHGDAWYDQTSVSQIPREVKLGVYLSDVRSGAFTYVKGSHRQAHPRTYRASELANIAPERIIQVTGPAGSAFLFDTSGIHRQAVPILEPREAVFLNYHNPGVPLQREDLDYYRYHPLLLNAAFLGGLSEEDRKILGFGNKTNYIPAFERHPKHVLLRKCFSTAYEAKLRLDVLGARVVGKLRRILMKG
jgi:hypothetical protein